MFLWTPTSILMWELSNREKKIVQPTETDKLLRSLLDRHPISLSADPADVAITALHSAANLRVGVATTAISVPMMLAIHRRYKSATPPSSSQFRALPIWRRLWARSRTSFFMAAAVVLPVSFVLPACASILAPDYRKEVARYLFSAQSPVPAAYRTWLRSRSDWGLNKENQPTSLRLEIDVNNKESDLAVLAPYGWPADAAEKRDTELTDDWMAPYVKKPLIIELMGARFGEGSV